MVHGRLPGRLALYAVFAAFVLVFAWQIVMGSGLLPGDTGREPVAGPSETASGSGVMGLAAWPWVLTVLAGTVILGVAIAWAEYRTRRLSPSDWQAGEAKTHAIYKDEK